MRSTSFVQSHLRICLIKPLSFIYLQWWSAHQQLLSLQILQSKGADCLKLNAEAFLLHLQELVPFKDNPRLAYSMLPVTYPHKSLLTLLKMSS